MQIKNSLNVYENAKKNTHIVKPYIFVKFKTTVSCFTFIITIFMISNENVYNFKHNMLILFKEFWCPNSFGYL